MRPSPFTPVDEHLFHVQAAIDRHGVFHTCVLGDQHHPDYQYTVGLLLQDHPELTIIGPEARTGAGVLQHLFERVRDGERFEADESVDHDVMGIPVRFLDVPDEHYTVPHCLLAGIPSYLAHTTGILPDRVVLQVVWPDSDGRWPWDPDVDPTVRRDQPVLAHGDAPVRRPPLSQPIDNSCRCDDCRHRASEARRSRGA